MIVQTTSQSDLESVARQALPASATAQDLERLITAIRYANPGVTFENIQPGIAIIVPNTSTTTAASSAVADKVLSNVESTVAAAIRELTTIGAESESASLTAVTQQWIAQVNNLTAPR